MPVRDQDSTIVSWQSTQFSAPASDGGAVQAAARCGSGSLRETGGTGNPAAAFGAVASEASSQATRTRAASAAVIALALARALTLLDPMLRA